jgi:hypothetical protein
MTFVGKILVFVIMVFAVIGLALSSAVFVAHTDWKDKTTKAQGEIQKLKTALNEANDKTAAAEKDLDAAKKKHEADIQQLNGEIANLNEQTKKAEAQATESRNTLGATMRNAQLALEEANAKKAETDQLRVLKSAVEKQANDYKLRQTELLDRIHELERMLETSKAHEKDLRDRVSGLSSALRERGFPDDPALYKGLGAPPPVEGEVTRVDKGNHIIEISIGSDDGLVPGHELSLFRTTPRAEYLGRVKITSVDPDQAVAKVVGHTIQGKKILEGDHVSTTLRTR